MIPFHKFIKNFIERGITIWKEGSHLLWIENPGNTRMCIL
jgi:hypothetical protein